MHAKIFDFKEAVPGVVERLTFQWLEGIGWPLPKFGGPIPLVSG